MTRLPHCAFVAVTIIAVGTTITSLSHPRRRDEPDVPELELHIPPHTGDPIGFDANGTECLFEANLDALGAFRNAFVERFPLCPSTGRRMQERIYEVVIGADVVHDCNTIPGDGIIRRLRPCESCSCQLPFSTINSNCVGATKEFAIDLAVSSANVEVDDFVESSTCSIGTCRIVDILSNMEIHCTDGAELQLVNGKFTCYLPGCENREIICNSGNA